MEEQAIMKATTFPTNTAAQATLYAALVQARRISTCAMCAGVRKIVADDATGERYIYCARCQDAVPVVGD